MHIVFPFFKQGLDQTLPNCEKCRHFESYSLTFV